jgi:hypothetical protein
VESGIGAWEKGLILLMRHDGISTQLDFDGEVSLTATHPAQMVDFILAKN